ncbi:hypothetical protein P5706_15690 [Pseudomonas sp. ChxA]|uniref:hypothetical protein n=1 Tax=Pseudomonas sp. ChxA TaxID=3035473 RepID=UPI002556D600|nr:hypothetical protein [Pseudomonas sp. ChxA]MDL2185627.1 hypothetical protein [Pseudomonas sp. ChxA]
MTINVTRKAITSLRKDEYVVKDGRVWKVRERCNEATHSLALWRIQAITSPAAVEYLAGGSLTMVETVVPLYKSWEDKEPEREGFYVQA